MCLRPYYLSYDALVRDPVKRETGERPVRTRHCNCVALYLLRKYVILMSLQFCSCAGRTQLVEHLWEDDKYFLAIRTL